MHNVFIHFVGDTQQLYLVQHQSSVSGVKRSQRSQSHHYGDITSVFGINSHKMDETGKVVKVPYSMCVCVGKGGGWSVLCICTLYLLNNFIKHFLLRTLRSDKQIFRICTVVPLFPHNIEDKL